jgi:hypothetical protein
MFKRRFWNETEKDKKDAEDDSSSSDDEAADGLDEAGSEGEGSSEGDSQASGASFYADRRARRGRIDRERCFTAPERFVPLSPHRGWGKSPADDESDDDQQEGTLARDLRELRERQQAGENGAKGVKAGKAGKGVKGAKKAARKEEEEQSASGSDDESSADSGSDSDDEGTFEARRCLACPKVILLSLSAVADHVQGKVRCASPPSLRAA